MITINIEIRYANSMVGCPDYIKTTKEAALIESVQDAMEGVYAKYPALRGSPYVLVPSKKWQRLSSKVYFFTEDPKQGKPHICFIRKRDYHRIETESIPIYLIFPYKTDIVPIKADYFESDDFLDP